MTDQLPVPEFLTQRPDVVGGLWTISSGYGYPYSDLASRSIHAPTGKSEWSQTVRARELIRSQFSPPDLTKTAADLWYPEVVVRACEEIRINALTNQAGYNLNNLQDGGEPFHGVRIEKDQSWEEAVLLICAMSLSTRGDAFISAMTDRFWWGPLKTLLEVIRKAPTKGLNVIALAKNQSVSLGFLRGIELYAPMVMRALNHNDSSAVKEGFSWGDGSFSDQDFMTATPFAQIKMATLPMVPAQSGSLGRATTASVMGRAVTHPERLVTDPQKRIFSSPAPSAGGVVVIDLSSSLSFSNEDLDRILQAAPGAYVFGYSHDPDWCSPIPSAPNAWLMAAYGLRCTLEEPLGHGGNGVDGPALSLAVAVRNGNDPIIWITDGVVSDYRDEINPMCAMECLGLIRQHNIHVAESIDDGVQLLQLLTAGHTRELTAPKKLIDMAFSRR